MYSEIYKNAVYKDNKTVFRGLTVTCPLCGREFGCNKTHHVYTALVGRKRQYSFIRSTTILVLELIVSGPLREFVTAYETGG